MLDEARVEGKGVKGRKKDDVIQVLLRLVQSLNSPFFPPHIGAEPGRAKEESRITWMRMLRTN